MSLLHSALVRAAAEHPEQPAVRCGDSTLSYADLDRHSLQLASLLREVGIGRGHRVAIHQLKSIEMVVAIYGIMRAGACFVPIDPRSPAERVGAILHDCAVQATITDSTGYGVLQVIDRCDLKMIVHPDAMTLSETLEQVPHRNWSAVRSHVPSRNLLRVDPDDLAYIMYTSGSTGPPKGMMHSHRSSLGFAGWGQRFCSLDAGDVVANFSPLHFDISVFDIFSSVLGASCVVLIPENIQLFPAQVAAVLESTETTIVFTVPFALSRLCALGRLDRRRLESLRWVLFGGEPFQPGDLAALMNALPGARFANVYGPAEAPACVVHEVTAIPRTDSPIPIGGLAPDTIARVVEVGGLDEVAPGSVGELLIASPSITLGYWGRPELNAATRLVHHGQEFFRTGDLVRESPAGLFHFIGRNDRMIKSRGFRIELDEIEAAVAAHAEVEEAAVFAVEEAGTKLVHAAIVAVAGSIDLGALTESLATRLPNYAVPVRIYVVPEMPRTTSDKIDRRALADRYRTDDS